MKKLFIVLLLTLSISANQMADVEKMQKGCDDSSMKHCSTLGFVYETGTNEIAQNYNKAIALYKKACDGGFVLACDNLGYMYYYGKGVKQNKIIAADILQKACNGGNDNACYNLGTMYYSGDGTEIDKTKAKILFEIACTIGNKDGCHNYEILNKELAKQNNNYIGKEIKILKKFCAGQNAEACFSLAIRYYAKENLTESKQYFESACDGGVADGCMYLGLMYNRGKGVPPQIMHYQKNIIKKLVTREAKEDVVGSKN